MLIRTIIISNYPDKVIVSRQRRPVYFVNNPTKKGKREIPKKYKIDRYFFNREGYLTDRQTNERVIANTRSVGTPRYWVVNFQDIWSGVVAAQLRAALANKIKDILRPYITAVVPIEGSELYPLRLEIELHNSTFTVDASNKGVIYTKIIEDLLVTEGKIPDDSPEYINDTGRIKLINSTDTPKMIIKIYKSQSNE